jgi:hypothetical protein
MEYWNIYIRFWKMEFKIQPDASDFYKRRDKNYSEWWHTYQQRLVLAEWVRLS